MLWAEVSHPWIGREILWTSEILLSFLNSSYEDSLKWHTDFSFSTKPFQCPEENMKHEIVIQCATEWRLLLYCEQLDVQWDFVKIHFFFRNRENIWTTE